MIGGTNTATKSEKAMHTATKEVLCCAELPTLSSIGCVRPGLENLQLPVQDLSSPYMFLLSNQYMDYEEINSGVGDTPVEKILSTSQEHDIMETILGASGIGMDSEPEYIHTSLKH